MFIILSLGVYFWITSYLTDGLMFISREMYFGEDDVVDIDRAISGDLGDLNKLRQIFEDVKYFGKKHTNLIFLNSD